PGQAVLVLEPAADMRLGIAAGAQLVPVVVELLLVFDIDLQRHRLVELEDRSAVECRERQARELELHREHGTVLLAVGLETGLAVAGDPADFRVREDSDVVTRGLLGLAGEPQARGDFLADLHANFSVSVVSPDSRTAAVQFDSPSY